jgi:Ca2+-binding RTX toxin-like protein
MTIDVEELQFVDQGAACDFTTVLTSAQLLSFDLIRLGTENREDDQFTIRMADNGDLVLPEVSQWMRLELNDAGQMVDMRGVGTDWVPWIEGGDGDDEVYAPEFAAAWFRAWLNGGDDTFHGSFLDDEVDGGDGRDTLDGSFGDDTLLGGTGNDRLFGGQGNDHVTDILNGGQGADKLNGGVGDDTHVYKKAGESTGKAFDTVVGFDFDAMDVFDIKGNVTGIDAAVTTGTLSKATFNDDLADAIGNGDLAVDHAVLFTADAGDYAGKTFLIVNVNGETGYEANKDIVILLQSGVNLNSLDTADFT